MASKKTKKTKFVPRAVLGSMTLVSVVPAVALVACGGELTQASAQADAGGKPDTGSFGGVGAVGFGVSAVGFDDAGLIGVATTAFDAAVMGVAATGFDAAGFTVAASGFDAASMGVAATGFDAAGFSVGANAFDASPDDEGGNEDAG